MDGPALVVRQDSPFNAETPREALATHLHTPNELFYVRSHLPAPHIAEQEYRLTVQGAFGVAEWPLRANAAALLASVSLICQEEAVACHIMLLAALCGGIKSRA
jgi:hypothetical protein